MSKVAVRFSQRDITQAPRAEWFDHRSGWWRSVSFHMAIEWIKTGKAERQYVSCYFDSMHRDQAMQQHVESLVDKELMYVGSQQKIIQSTKH